MVFVGNHIAYEELLGWLKKDLQQNAKLSYDSVCLVSGASGIGKTTGVIKAVESLNQKLIKIDCTSCINSKDFKDILLKVATSDLIAQLEHTSIERVILIDELEAFVSLDRTFVNSFVNILDSKSFRNIKIIITCSLPDLKFFAKCKIISLYYPKEADIIVFLRNEFPMLSYSTILEIAESCNGNISSAIMTARFEIIGVNNDHVSTIASPDFIPDVAALFTDISKEKTTCILIQDPWLHPLRFHENILCELKQRKGLQILKYNIYFKILTGMCEWDQMMSFFKGKDLLIPTEYVTSLIQTVKVLQNKKNHIPNVNNFTRLFNYLSLKKKNKIALYSHEFPWNTLSNVHRNIIEQPKKSKKFSI
jgi:hypothetical protein